MITIFAVPKPFEGHVGTIQRNAIESWARLDGADVLLIGDDAGVAEAATAIGARHVPDVAKTPQGTPLVSSAFEIARESSAKPLLGYVNADIILLPDFTAALRRVSRDQYLLVGQRWEADIREPIEFDDPDWEDRLRASTLGAAQLAGPHWIDFFVLPRASPVIADFPPFAIGRPTWDNWLIRRTRSARIPVIDGTTAITAVHQRHDYLHVPGGTGRVWEGPEATANRELLDAGEKFGIWHATHILRDAGPAPAWAPRYLRRRWEARDDVDGPVERFSRWIDPALAPARWLYSRTRRRASR